MGNYAIKRLVLFIPTLFILTFIVFFMMWVLPGDPALFILSGGGDASNLRVSPEELAKLRSQLGLDRPFLVQYVDWLSDLVRGDFGNSIVHRSPVVEDIKLKLPVTVELAVLAMILAFLIAVPLGILSAISRNSWVDHGARMFTSTGLAIPSFWIGILFIYALSVWFNWLPPLDYANLWENPLRNLQQLLIPAVAIAFHDLAWTARLTRSSMLEVMREDYVRTARAKGLREVNVIGRHALKNALLVPLTSSGWQFGRLLGGTVVIETIFLVPGIGTYLLNSTLQRDFVAVQAVVVLVGVLILVLNLAIDLLYGVLDPRIRYQ